MQKRETIIVLDIWAKVIKQAESEIEKTKKALNWVKVVELKKENAKMTVQKKLQKQLHKKLKAYLKTWLALAHLLKWFSWVIYRYNWKIKFYRLLVIGYPISSRWCGTINILSNKKKLLFEYLFEIIKKLILVLVIFLLIIIANKKYVFLNYVYIYLLSVTFF